MHNLKFYLSSKTQTINNMTKYNGQARNSRHTNAYEQGQTNQWRHIIWWEQQGTGEHNRDNEQADLTELIGEFKIKQHCTVAQVSGTPG